MFRSALAFHRQVAEIIGETVLATAVEMKERPAGQANFFDELQRKIDGAVNEGGTVGGKYGLKTSSPEFVSAARRCVTWRTRASD